MTLASLRRNIGIVQQDVFLFAGTIRENIAYGRLGATDDDIWEAARRARLEEIISGLSSGLDTETERAIQESLADLAVGRTTLVIAHRLATIRNADRIVVVDETGVAEQGRHDELVRAAGVYQRLHEAQCRS